MTDVPLARYAFATLVAPDSPKLSRVAKRAIAKASNDVFVSVASLWEARIKEGLGKLKLPHPGSPSRLVQRGKVSRRQVPRGLGSKPTEPPWAFMT